MTTLADRAASTPVAPPKPPSSKETMGNYVVYENDPKAQRLLAALAADHALRTTSGWDNAAGMLRVLLGALGLDGLPPHKHTKPLVDCARCHRRRPHGGHGLCTSCGHRQDRKDRPVVRCGNCGRWRQHEALGLCPTCYQRVRRARGRR